MRFIFLFLFFTQLAIAQSPVVLFFRNPISLWPTNFPTLGGWWVASDLLADGYVDDNQVTNWNSRVNGYKFTNMLAGTTRPVLKTTGFGGYPGLKFISGPNSNQTMVIYPSRIDMDAAGGAGQTVIIVGIYTNTAAPLNSPLGEGDTAWIVNQSAANTTWLYFGGSFKDATFGFGQNNTRMDSWGRTNNNFVYIMQNQTNAFVGASAMASSMNIKNLVPVALNTTMHIAEICVWTNYMLTATEVTNLYQRYFQPKYGTNNLPFGNY